MKEILMRMEAASPSSWTHRRSASWLPSANINSPIIKTLFYPIVNEAYSSYYYVLSGYSGTSS